jgi:uncharacterized protein
MQEWVTESFVLAEIPSTIRFSMRHLLPFLLAVMASTAVQASPPSEESVNALLQSINAESSIEVVLKEMDQTLQESMELLTAQDKLSPKQKSSLDAFRARFNRGMREELSWRKLRPVVAQVYRETYTQEEVDGLLAFFRSPAGISYTRKTPVVLQKTSALVQEHIAPLAKQMEQEIQKAFEEAFGATLPRADAPELGSFEKILTLAARGDPESVNAACYRYLYGEHGVAKDLAKAADWCEKGVALGMSSSMTMLAETLAADGERKNVPRARQLYEQAAKLGHPHAQFVLAAMYWNGDGGVQDIERAQQFVNLSVAQNYQPAIELKARFERLLAAKKQATR